MANPGEHDGIAEHFFDLLHGHANALKNIHGMSPKEPVPSAVNFRERTFPEVTFHPPNNLSVFQESHGY
jgi:hypothetical protein